MPVATAIRILANYGVPRHTARDITGHKKPSQLVYLRFKKKPFEEIQVFNPQGKRIGGWVPWRVKNNTASEKQKK